MTATNSCGCGTAPKLIYACSGAADVGELCDQAARTLAREGVGRLYCLAGIGAEIDVMVANARSASASLALDGCAMDCAKKTLEKAGVENIAHFRASDHGFEKGKSPVTPENVERLASLARPLLNCRAGEVL